MSIPDPKKLKRFIPSAVATVCFCIPVFTVITVSKLVDFVPTDYVSSVADKGVIYILIAIFFEHWAGDRLAKNENRNLRVDTKILEQRVKFLEREDTLPNDFTDKLLMEKKYLFEDWKVVQHENGEMLSAFRTGCQLLILLGTVMWGFPQLFDGNLK